MSKLRIKTKSHTEKQFKTRGNFVLKFEPPPPRQRFQGTPLCKLLKVIYVPE